jgi:hypothetical protein
MSVSWVIASLSLLLLAAAGMLWLRFAPKRESAELPEKWPLTARRVFGQQELRVFRQLREALPEHVLLSKLPLVRFCHPDDPAAVRYWFELLGNQYVSFAICSESGRVLAAIDLEGLRPSSRRSLQIKKSVLAACKVKYLCCTPEQLPSLPELRALVPAPAAKPATPLPAWDGVGPPPAPESLPAKQFNLPGFQVGDPSSAGGAPERCRKWVTSSPAGRASRTGWRASSASRACPSRAGSARR